MDRHVSSVHNRSVFLDMAGVHNILWLVDETWGG